MPFASAICEPPYYDCFHHDHPHPKVDVVVVESQHLSTSRSWVKKMSVKKVVRTKRGPLAPFFGIQYQNIELNGS